MAFAALHIQKAKGNQTNLGHHIDRTPGHEKSYEQADPTRIKLNRNIEVNYFCSIPLQEAIDRRIKQGYNVRNKKGELKVIRKDAVKSLDIMLTGSHEKMLELQGNKDYFNLWVEENLKFIKHKFGAENIVRFSVHLDEKTPHIHAVVVPITTDGRLSAQDWMDTGDKLTKLQTDYADLMSPFGLERGIKSEKKHEDTKVWYRKNNLIKKEYGEELAPIQTKLEKLSRLSLNFEKEKKAISDDLTTLFHNLVEKHENTIKVQEIEKNKQIEEVKLFEKAKHTTISLPPPKRKFIKPELISKAKNESSLLEFFNNNPYLAFERKIGNEYRYAKRGQNTGSISVNENTGKWYDFSSDQKGDIIEAIKVFQNKTYYEAVEELFEKKYQFTDTTEKFQESTKKAEKNEGYAVTSLRHPALIDYCLNRGIDEALAKKWLVQVHQGDSFNVGWINSENSISVSNNDFKGFLKGTESDIKFILGKTNDLLVFEGMFDYLSYLKLNNVTEANASVIILNSTNNIDLAKDFISKNSAKLNNIWLCLDNDEAGNKATDELKYYCSAFELKHEDLRQQWAKHTDINDWLLDEIIQTHKEQKAGQQLGGYRGPRR